ncbi:MAG: DUF1015 domain-containing protein [Christensenellales bacterium]
MNRFDYVGLHPYEILLPSLSEQGFEKWAVIACDQHTSHLQYWQNVEKYVGDAPSTFRMILPEAYLDSPDLEERIVNIRNTMKHYLDSRLLYSPGCGFILVSRQVSSGARHGLVCALDLECYDFSKNSSSLIRPTEGTIPERIPPRLKIRDGALLELPHILILIDDPKKTVIEPLLNQKLPMLYDFGLMEQGGHISGWFADSSYEGSITKALLSLKSKNRSMLYAVGDGNHSLATAKSHWEIIKQQLSQADQETHPARFALVEIVNLHDDALRFLAIHRMVLNPQDCLAFMTQNGGAIANCASHEECVQLSQQLYSRDVHAFPFCLDGRFGVLKLPAAHIVPYGTLQPLLEQYVSEFPAAKLDYIHGDEELIRLCGLQQSLGFFLPPLDKNMLFPTVEQDGQLPKKSFSIGESFEKRYYIECKRITR